MDHRDHVRFLKDGVDPPRGIWADFGAGTGAFTLALADLLEQDGAIIAIDQDAARLRANENSMRSSFPDANASFIEADFTDVIELPPLEGLVIANALHFVSAQIDVVKLLRGYLATGAHAVVVEYNIDTPNRAVPRPVPYSRWIELAAEAGFSQSELLVRRPSSSMGEIYSAVSW